MKNLNIYLKIIDDNSNEKIINKINYIVNKHEINFDISNLNIEKYRSHQKFSDDERMIAHNSHIFMSKDFAKNSNFDLLFFVEDDYIHKINTIEEMIYSYEKFSTIFQRDIILCPSDYPYLYQPKINSSIYIGQNLHWRSIDQSLCTYMISSKVLNEYWVKYYEMMTNNYKTYEKPLHDIYKIVPCLSPIPTLSIHLANLNTIYGLSPLCDWQELWDVNKYD